VLDFLDSERIRWIITTLVPLVVELGVIFGPWMLGTNFAEGRLEEVQSRVFVHDEKGV
jgi:hypothetical protein